MNVNAEYVRTELLELVAAAMEAGLAEYVGFDVTDGELTAESYDAVGDVVGSWRVEIVVTQVTS